MSVSITDEQKNDMTTAAQTGPASSSAPTTAGVRQPDRLLFRTACRALLLAIGLPVLVFMGGMIRARQFHLKADTRWSEYVPQPLALAIASQDRSNSTQRHDKRLMQTASLSTDSLLTLSSVSLETSSPGDKADDPRRTSERPADAANDSVSKRTLEHLDRGSPERQLNSVTAGETSNVAIARSTRRIEGAVQQIHQRLDHLSRRQTEHQVEDSLQQTIIIDQQNDVLKREAELIEAFKSTVVKTKPARSTSVTRPLASKQPLISTTASSGTNTDQAAGKASDDQSANDTARVAQRPDAASLNPGICYKPASSNDPKIEDESSESEKTAPVESAVVNRPVQLSEVIEIGDETIRIRRETGKDMAFLFTIDAENADIGQLFSKLSLAAKTGIVTSPGVHGAMTLHLHKVRLDAAVKAIVKSRDFVFEREGGIIVIRTIEEAERMKRQTAKVAFKSDAIR